MEMTFRPQQSVTVLRVTLLSLLLGGLTTNWCNGSDIPLAEIRDTLREEYSSIRSIDVKYHQTFETSRQELSPNAQHQCEWLVDGNKFATYSHVLGEDSSWVVKAFDGKSTEVGRLTSLEPRRVQNLQRFRGEHPTTLKASTYALAFGYAFRNESGDLATLLQDPLVEVMGWEACDGHECVKVESEKVHARVGGKVYRYTAWLDPAVQWLPRRLICRLDPSSHKYEQSTSNGRFAELSDYRLLEYGWFPDPVLNRKRPLPIHIVETNWMGRTTLRTDSISVNSPISPDRFLVDPTFNTQTRLSAEVTGVQ